MASGNMKEIRGRIRSVESTMQITKAMELVATSKLKKAKQKAEDSRPYFDTLYQTMRTIASDIKGFKSKYTDERNEKYTGYIVVAGDRGLAGGYNANVLKLALSHMQDKNCKIFAVGRKAIEMFKKIDNCKILKEYQGVAETLDVADALEIAKDVEKAFSAGEIDSLYIVYTKLVSPLVQEPELLKMLPLKFEDNTKDSSLELTEYDPTPEDVFDAIVPQYLSGVVYGGVLESFASEQGARRVAMESANDNAQAMIDELSLKYNRARQASITQEISEIVGGAEALNG